MNDKSALALSSVRSSAASEGTMRRANADQFAEMLDVLIRELPATSAVRRDSSFQRLQRLRALKNLRIIETPHSPMNGFMDFSAGGVKARFSAGYDAVEKYFAQSGAQDTPRSPP